MSKTPEELAEEFADSGLYRLKRYVDGRIKFSQGALGLQNRACKYGFLAGYKAAQPQWISVKDRLPEFGDWVLLYANDSNIYRGRLIHDDFDFFATFDGIVFLLEKPGITHWMPLHQPPKEEEK